MRVHRKEYSFNTPDLTIPHELEEIPGNAYLNRIEFNTWGKIRIIRVYDGPTLIKTVHCNVHYSLLERMRINRGLRFVSDAGGPISVNVVISYERDSVCYYFGGDIVTT
jgi:hypothetical protein